MFDTLAFTQRLVEAGVAEQEARAIATELAQVALETDLLYADELATSASCPHCIVVISTARVASKKTTSRGASHQCHARPSSVPGHRFWASYVIPNSFCFGPSLS